MALEASAARLMLREYRAVMQQPQCLSAACWSPHLLAFLSTQWAVGESFLLWHYRCVTLSPVCNSDEIHWRSQIWRFRLDGMQSWHQSLRPVSVGQLIWFALLYSEPVLMQPGSFPQQLQLPEYREQSIGELRVCVVSTWNVFNVGFFKVSEHSLSGLHKQMKRSVCDEEYVCFSASFGHCRQNFTSSWVQSSPPEHFCSETRSGKGKSRCLWTSASFGQM